MRPEHQPIHRASAPPPDSLPSSYNPNEVNMVFPIESLTLEEKFNVINQFLSLEHKYLRAPHGLPQISADGKIKFLTGGRDNDVTSARDFEGRLIHTRYLDNPKDPAPKLGEIMEAIGALSIWFEKYGDAKAHGAPPPPRHHLINEVSDVVYCLSHLMILDAPEREQYKIYIQSIADSLGYSVDQLLTLTIMKYNFRLGQGKSIKNHALEDQIWTKVMSEKNPDGSPKYPEPTNEQLRSTYHALSVINSLLPGRVNVLQWMHKKGIRPRR